MGILSSNSDGDGEGTGTYAKYRGWSAAKEKFHSKTEDPYPEKYASGRYFSSRGWLLRIIDSCTSPNYTTLVHPFSRVQLKLPCIETLVASYPYERDWHCEEGDQVWRKINTSNNAKHFVDAICFQNQFYAIDGFGLIFAVKDDDDGTLFVVSRRGVQVSPTHLGYLTEENTYTTLGFQYLCAAALVLSVIATSDAISKELHQGLIAVAIHHARGTNVHTTPRFRVSGYFEVSRQRLAVTLSAIFSCTFRLKRRPYWKIKSSSCRKVAFVGRTYASRFERELLVWVVVRA
ncbi:hypothetical protein WN943_001772 [Citrus x changshan-huyou]